MRREERRRFGFFGSFVTRARNLVSIIVSSRGTISRSSVGTPALARCAAICAPIVPAPRTAAFLTEIMAANHTE